MWIAQTLEVGWQSYAAFISLHLAACKHVHSRPQWLWKQDKGFSPCLDTNQTRDWCTPCWTRRTRAYRSCTGIFSFRVKRLCGASVCYFWTFTINVQVAKHSMECLGYFCTCLLGCTDQCMMLKYESHQRLLRYSLEDYIAEIFSDSDWAKHRTSPGSVSAGYLFMLGNLLRSSSRSQKAFALSSCEAEVSAGASGTSDAVVMHHCMCRVLVLAPMRQSKWILPSTSLLEEFLPSFSPAHQFACGMDAAERAGEMSKCWVRKHKAESKWFGNKDNESRSHVLCDVSLYGLWPKHFSVRGLWGEWQNGTRNCDT